MFSRRAFLSCVACVALLSCSRRASQQELDQAARDAVFQERMKNVTLLGRSVTWNREGLSGEERYVISSISKLGGTSWLFHTRLKIAGREVPVPLPVRIEWAADTPVITLTDLWIPTMGTFTARVLLYRDQYAGTWSSREHGGQLFGRIVRANP